MWSVRKLTNKVDINVEKVSSSIKFLRLFASKIKVKENSVEPMWIEV